MKNKRSFQQSHNAVNAWHSYGTRVAIYKGEVWENNMSGISERMKASKTSRGNEGDYFWWNGSLMLCNLLGGKLRGVSTSPCNCETGLCLTLIYRFLVTTCLFSLGNPEQSQLLCLSPTSYLKKSQGLTWNMTGQSPTCVVLCMQIQLSIQLSGLHLHLTQAKNTGQYWTRPPRVIIALMIRQNGSADY